MSDQTFQAYQQVSKELTKISWLWRLLILSRIVLKWLALSIALLLIFAAISSVSFWIFTATIASVAGDVFSVLWVLISVALVVWIAAKSGFSLTSKDQTAALIDSKLPDSKEKVISAFQLFPELERNRYGYSKTFLSKIVNDAGSEVKNCRLRSIFADDLNDLKKGALLLSLSLLLTVASNSIFPNNIHNFFRSFPFYSSGANQSFGLEILSVEPGNYELEPGSDVRISAKLKGIPKSQVKILYKSGISPLENVGDLTEKWSSQTMNSIEGSDSDQSDKFNPFNPTKSADETKSYQMTFKNVSEPIKYYISADQIRSEEYQISTIRRPILSRFQLKLEYPKYSKIPPKTLDENVGEVQALVGTELEFNGRANKPLKSAQLNFDDGMKVDLELTNPADKKNVSGRFILKRSGKYHVSLTDEGLNQNRDPISYTIDAIKDQAPKVEIIYPAQDLILDDSMKIPLQIEATDDYGLSVLRLRYKVEGQKSEEKVIDIKTVKNQTTAASAQYTWDLNPLHLFPEDVVIYYAEALDTDDISGPNLGRSRSYMARFPSLVELMEEIQNEQGEALGQMEKTIEDQRDVKAITDELTDRLRKNQELTWNEKKQLEKAIQIQQEIEKQAQRLSEQLEKTTIKVEERSLLSRETIEKHQQLQKLIEEVATEEMKEAMKKLSEALKELNPSEQEKKLLEASFKEEELIQRLEQMIELFKKLRLQQRLEAATNEAKQLKERQKEIADQTEQAFEKPTAEKSLETSNQNPKSKIQNPNLDELGNREERNAEALSNLQQELQDLSEEMKKEGDNYERVAEEVRQVAQESERKQVEEKLRLASRRLRQNQPQLALDPASEALAGLRELHQGLDNAMEFMRGANADKALKAMQKAVRGGLHISESHEEIMKKTLQLLSNLKSPQTPGEMRRLDQLAAEELRAAEKSEIVAQQLWDLTSNDNAMMVDPKLIWRLRAVSDALTRSARSLEDKNPSLSVAIQKGALSDINRTVADLLRAMEQMNQQMSAAGLENMLEQLEQIAQNQSQINELSKQLSEQLRQQGKSRQIDDMLKQMAYEQSLVKEATQRLAEKMDKLAQTLGNLSDLAKDMQDVEGELRKGNIDDKVLKKQREILTRLLESEKSLQKRQTSEKRKAQSARQQYLNPSPSELDPELVKLKKELNQFNISEGEKLPEAYKELIQLYYKALSEKVRP